MFPDSDRRKGKIITSAQCSWDYAIAISLAQKGNSVNNLGRIHPRVARVQSI